MCVSVSGWMSRFAQVIGQRGVSGQTELGNVRGSMLPNMDGDEHARIYACL